MLKNTEHCRNIRFLYVCKSTTNNACTSVISISVRAGQKHDRPIFISTGPFLSDRPTLVLVPARFEQIQIIVTARNFCKKLGMAKCKHPAPRMTPLGYATNFRIIYNAYCTLIFYKVYSEFDSLSLYTTIRRVQYINRAFMNAAGVEAVICLSFFLEIVIHTIYPERSNKLFFSLHIYTRSPIVAKAILLYIGNMLHELARERFEYLNPVSIFSLLKNYTDVNILYYNIPGIESLWFR